MSHSNWNQILSSQSSSSNVDRAGQNRKIAGKKKLPFNLDMAAKLFGIVFTWFRDIDNFFNETNCSMACGIAPMALSPNKISVKFRFSSVQMSGNSVNWFFSAFTTVSFGKPCKAGIAVSWLCDTLIAVKFCNFTIDSGNSEIWLRDKSNIFSLSNWPIADDTEVIWLSYNKSVCKLLSFDRSSGTVDNMVPLIFNKFNDSSVKIDESRPLAEIRSLISAPDNLISRLFSLFAWSTSGHIVDDWLQSVKFHNIEQLEFSRCCCWCTCCLPIARLLKYAE